MADNESARDDPRNKGMLYWAGNWKKHLPDIRLKKYAEALMRGEKEDMMELKQAPNPLSFTGLYKPGKPSAGDKQQGTPSFPKTYALARENLLGSPELDTVDFAEYLSLVKEAGRRGYEIDRSRSLDDLDGHPETKDGGRIYLAGDFGNYGTDTILIAHALGHDERNSEKEVQTWATRYLAELFGDDHPTAITSRLLESCMDEVH